LKLHLNLLEAVADALYLTFEKGQYADRVLEKILKSNTRWGARDRAFIAENTYNIVRYWNRVEAHLPMNEDINFFDAAIVWLVLSDFPLPNWQEFDHINIPAIIANDKKYMEDPLYRESLPEWLFDAIENELGTKTLPMLAELNRPAALYIRANTIKTNHKELLEKLKAEEIFAEHLFDDVFLVNQKASVFKNERFKAGLFEIQDAHSQMIATYMDVKPGMRVVDACAGAGGKSLHIAALMQNKGRIISLDVEEWKLAELRKRARRAGAGIIETKIIENSKTIKRLAETADRLLLDVPCSGLGVLKRNPDAKWKLSAEFLDKVRGQQEEILANYAKICKKGGKLVYATCSILPSENEKQIEKFLAGNSEFTLIKSQTVPPNQRGDGFFMALLERKQ